jgi:hypothetical protein
MNEPSRKPILKASEIGQFIYCPVAWYLQRQGYKVESPVLDRGLEKHVDLGEQIDTVTEAEKESQLFFYVGLGLMLITGLVFILWLVFSS